MDSDDKNQFAGVRVFTVEELDKVARDIWPKLASYRAEDQSIIPAQDYHRLYRMMGWERTDEQVNQYIHYLFRQFGERLTYPVFRDVMVTQHNRMLYFEWLIKNLDLNGDGFISREEYEVGMDTLVIHEPRLVKISFEQLLEESDVNKDGKSSVHEMLQWVASVDNRVNKARDESTK